ncbi:glycosyltransferase [Methylomagnum sp.]
MNKTTTTKQEKMLTILMATHNGSGTLPRVLDSYLRLESPKGKWRLIIIDNASTDETPNILASYAKNLPLLPLRIETRGKNIALNRGLDYVEGDLVVFTDDDAIPRSGWLAALRRAASEHPEFDLFAGRIEPIWPHQLPEWIPQWVNLGAAYAITPTTTMPGQVPANQVWGANMAVRQRVFAAGHRFNETVGPASGQYIMGSEVEFTCRVEQSGCKAWFVDDARVGHLIRPEQMERAWLIRRAYRLGKHIYHQDRLGYTEVSHLSWLALFWKYPRLGAGYVRRLIARRQRDNQRMFSADWEISFAKGYLSESLISLPGRWSLP